MAPSLDSRRQPRALSRVPRQRGSGARFAWSWFTAVALTGCVSEPGAGWGVLNADLHIHPVAATYVGVDGGTVHIRRFEATFQHLIAESHVPGDMNDDEPLEVDGHNHGSSSEVDIADTLTTSTAHFASRSSSYSLEVESTVDLQSFETIELSGCAVTQQCRYLPVGEVETIALEVQELKLEVVVAPSSDALSEVGEVYKISTKPFVLRTPVAMDVETGSYRHWHVETEFEIPGSIFDGIDWYTWSQPEIAVKSVENIQGSDDTFSLLSEPDILSGVDNPGQ